MTDHLPRVGASRRRDAPKPVRTAYLHIGLPKTGSTTIQGFLGVHRRALLADGLVLPDLGGGDFVRGQLALSGALSRERDPARPVTEPWRWLDRHLPQSACDVCISREGISKHFADPEQFAFVNGFFRRHGFRLKIIAYVRDHVGFLNAAYTQQVKKFRVTESFDHWLAAAIATPRYSYWSRFKPIFSAPDVAFSVRPLQQVVGDGLIRDFAAEIDRSSFGFLAFDPAPYRNAAPGPKAIAAAILVAKELKRRNIDPDQDQSLHRSFKEAAEARGWREQPFFGPDAKAIEAIISTFAKGDERVARRAWGRPWAEMAPTTLRPKHVFDQNTASPADIADVDELAREIIAKVPGGSVWRRAFSRA